jgi:UDP-N-acetylmuramate: L-alanyl-gamma-D-glutamyl-meso-diaminopimelate ligase
MLAWVLTHAGRDPGFLIGGLPRNYEYPFHLGQGDAFVIEGDEYDSAFFDKGPKFMHYRPDTALIGTVEFDHADIYGDLEQVKTAFGRLTNIVPRRGLVVYYADCDVTREVVSDAPCRVEGYGFASGDWRAVDFTESEEGAVFGVLRGGVPFCEVSMAASGEHSARNALAVIAAATEQGLGPPEIVAGLASFEGVRRRLEFRGEADGVQVYDDFAHHPTAIDATLRAVRKRHPRGRVWAVVEPRSWSLRRNIFQERLAQAFSAADEVVISNVYQAEQIPQEERLDPLKLVRDLVAGGQNARWLPDARAIAAELSNEAQPADVITVMSNGAFGGVHELLLASLRARINVARKL